MSTSRCVLALVLLLSWPRAAAHAEVIVRWDLDQVPPRESLDISTLVIPASKPAAAREAVARGFRVYLEVDVSALPEAPALADGVSGVVVRGSVSAGQLDELRLRAPGARVLSIDERGMWPHIRLNPVALRDNVLQVASRSAQPWMDSNAVFVRITAPGPNGAPLLLSPAWEPTTVADTRHGPALEDYLVAIAEAGSFGHDLVLRLHEGFERRLLLGQPAARADWQEIRRYLEFYSWDLPRRYRRISNVAVVSADPMGSIEILRLLTRHNLPFEQLAPDDLRAEALKGFAIVVLLDPLTPAQIRPLTAFAHDGGTVVLNGPPPGVAWEGAVPLVKNQRHAAYGVGSGRVLELLESIDDPDAFALSMREVLGPERRVVDVWNGITVLVAPYEDANADTVLVTVLDYAHDAQPIPVRVAGAFSSAHYESPESGPALLPLQHRNGHTEFVLPALRVGGRVFLTREHERR
jgi:hypothetical protein